MDQLQEMDSAGSLEGRYICIMHKGKRCVLRDSASKVKKKRLVKVGKYSQITKLLSENVQFPSIVLMDPHGLPELVWILPNKNCDIADVSSESSNDSGFFFFNFKWEIRFY